MSTINNRLKELRNKLGLSQAEFAEEIKVSRGYVSRYENGTLEINARIISLISSRFSVNENWLLTGEGTPFFDASAAMQKVFASYFIEITRAFSPVFSAYGEILPLFENPDIMRMYNYIAYKVKRGGADKKNIRALTQTFDSAFPGYETVIRDLERQTIKTRQDIESSKIAQTLRLPIVGQAAADNPQHGGTKGKQGGYDQTRKYGEKHVEGRAAAGMPINAIPDTETCVSVPAKYLSDNYFIVQAQGDSMIGANIDDGDYCVFQKNGHLDEGRIMLVQVEGSAEEPDVTIKRVFWRGGRIELHSENAKYPPMPYPADCVHLRGVLVDIMTPDA